MGPKGLLVCLLLTALISPTPYLIDAGLVKKILRHRRQTLSQHGENNITLPSVDQPVVFNHVYNINVPASAICSVDLDAPGTSLLDPREDLSSSGSSLSSSGLQATEHTLGGENQIVFTHRINIPRSACGCSETMPDIKALLSRLEMLEGEVSTLREQCGGDAACCSSQLTGEVGTKPYCSGHGNYSVESCGCVCEPGWAGANCSEEAGCPAGCQEGGGACVRGKCECFPGFSGEDCSVALCPVDCGENGRCVDGSCVCSEGFSGEDCSVVLCSVDCGDNGQCVDGTCVCSEGFSGEDCSVVLCSVDCGDNGQCVDGTCVCSEGFSGEDCSVVLCSVDCGDNGQCVDGTCVCSEGYVGEDCSQTACLNACLGRGRCEDGECVCLEPWTGEDCSELICPKDCYDRGRCLNGTCLCDQGFTGEDCGERTCPGDCQGNGFCVDGRCVCSAGYTGEDCSTLTCLNDCNDRGTCFNGMCICHAGYQGEDCSQLACLNNCNTRGQCINGQCACDVGFQGEDCSELSCPNNCLDRGRCVNGQCVCDEGFAGEDCSVRTCPSDCFLRGDCVDGRCVCFIGFQGEDCGELSCPNNCLDRGRCVDGQCVCDEGFTGEDCGQKSCLNDCMAQGVCVDGRCLCEEGYEGDDCSVLTCPDNCNNRGRCVRGECVCEHGYEGLSCGELSCLNNCQDNGRCVNGQCVCDEGYIGEDCSEVSPPKDLTVTDVTKETVGLRWDNQMLVTEYLVTYVPTAPGGLYQEFTVPGDTTAATVRELEPGIEYLINVYAVLSNKRSVPVSARVATHLPQPEGLRFYSVRETSVEVQWDHLDISFDGWELYIRNTKEENGQVVNTLPPSQTRFNQSGLGPGQEYQVSLNLLKNNTRGPQTSRTFSTRIDGPRQVQVKDVTDSSALVSWSPPVAEVDGITVAYGPVEDTTNTTQVELYGPAGVEDTTNTTQVELYGPVGVEDTTNITEVELSSSSSQYSLDGLDPDTLYQVTLTSRRGNATSRPVTLTFTTDLDPPRELQVVSLSEDSVSLQWINSLAEVDSYRVKYNHISGGGEHGEEVVPAGPEGSTQVTVTGLKPGTEYGIGVTAVKNERESLPATTNTETELDPPTDLQVSDSSETSLTLEWQKPLAKITGYRLESVSQDGERGEATVPAGDTIYVLTNLRPGVDYTVHLTAERGLKISLPAIVSASTASFTFYLAASDVPELTEPPTGLEENIISFVHLDPASDGQSSGVTPENQPGMHLNVSGVTSDGFDVSWEASAQRAGVYDSLAVECRDALRSRDMKEMVLPGNATGVRVQGLRASTEYQIKLYGMSHSQRSSALGEAVVVTASAPSSRGGVVALSIKDHPSKPPPRSASKAAPPTAPSDHHHGLSSDVELSGSSSDVELSGSSSDVELSGSSSGASESSVLDVEPSVSSSGAFKSSMPDVEPTVSSSGAPPEPSESSVPEILGELLVTNVTSASVALTWSSRPDGEAFDGFLVELSAESGPAAPGGTRKSTTLLPGGFRRAEIGGLTPATRYDISVYGLVEGERSLPIRVSATTEELKPAVVNLTVSDVTWDSFNVSWGAQDGDFEAFVIEVTNMEEEAGQSQNLTLSGDAFSLVLSGLSPNTSYLVGLYGMHQGDFLEPVFIEATTVNEPALGNLYVSNLTYESFTLSWNDTEGQFDGYVLEIIDSDWLTEPEEHNVSQSAKSHDVTGLRPNTDYVAYLYGTLKGSRTHAVSMVASTAPEPDLSRLVVSNVTSDRFALSWRAAGGQAFDNFIVEVRESALPSQAVGRSLPGEARSTLMAGLKASTRYDIKLYASAGGQKTPPLYAVAATEDVPQLGTVAATSVNPDNFTLSWSTLSGHFDGFVIRVSDSEQMTDTLEFTIDGEVQNFTVSKLADATAYDIELFGISHGRRTPSVLSHATTAALPKVENMTITNVTPYGFRVSWEMKDPAQEETGATAPSGGGGFSHFQVVVTDSGWLLKPHEFTIPGNQTWLDIWGLITGIGYEVRLTAVSNTGLSSRPLTTVAVTEAEPEVEHLFVSDVTEDSLRLTWTVDEDLFDRFVIKIRDSKKLASPQEHVAFGDERTKVLSGLMGGTEYEIELYGVSLDWRSQPVTAVAHTGLGSPRALQFSDISDTSATVEWTMPGSRVDSFRLVYVPLYGGNPVQLTVDSDVSRTTLTNLSPGTPYQVTVTAVKGLEESPPTTDTVTTDLDKPQGLTAVNVTDTSALLLWQPSVATVDGYVITYSADSVSPVEEHVSGNVVEFEMGSLVPATRYTVDVYATRESQQSASATTDFTTELDAPRDLEVKDVHTDSATVTWRPPQADIAGYTLTYTSPDGITKEVLLSPTAKSYSMKQLSASTEYTVTLQAVTRGQKSILVSTVFTTIGKLYSHPKDCAQIFLNGETTSGVYTIYLGGEEKQAIQAYCDMDTEGGGWTVFLRRQNGKLNFYKNWKNYSAGFGDLNDEFWMGLSSLHKMTSSGQYELRVDLRDGSESAYAQYDKFVVAEPRSRYKLYIGIYSGTAGDSMNYHHGRPFSTYDNDNDIAVTNCALSYKGAFWYKNCHRVNLMGKYGDDSHSKGINWFHWKGHEHSIPFAEMKLRPGNFRNFESRRKKRS